MSARPHTRKTTPAQHALRILLVVCLMPLPLGAADPQPAELQRLFFTPAQRAEMQTTRARPATGRTQSSLPGATDAPLRPSSMTAC